MTDRWEQIEDLFSRGLDGTDAERAALLDGIAADVASAVSELWAAAVLPVPFLENSTVDPATALVPGLRVADRFVLIESLGAGGMGEVFKARDEQLGRLVAIKCLHTEAYARVDGRRLLAHEARALCSLTDPHICTLYDLVWEGSTPFLVMEYLEGETLAARLDRGPVTLEDVWRIASELIAGLSAAHDAGVIHRDIKPGNIMLTPGGVKICDFGIATHMRSSAAVSPATTRRVATRLGSSAAVSPATTGRVATLLGSVSYVSPEQAEGKAVDARSDMFSVGCVLYEMITGQKAFLETSHLSTLAAVLKSEPRPIRELNPHVPSVLDALVVKCLKKDPDQRFGSMHEVMQALGSSRRERSSESVFGWFGGRGTSFPAFSSSLSTLVASRWLIPALVATAIVIAALSRLVTKSPLLAGDSIVVVPFATSADDADLEYLADGLSESLTNALSRLSTIRVIARPTALTYKGRDADVKKISRDLSVRMVLTGKVASGANRVRVQADLVDAQAGTQLWGQLYEGTTDDVLRIQEDLARNVRVHLRGATSDETRQDVARGGTPNAEAYRLYLKGRFALSRSTVADTQRAIEFFQRAIAIDPTNALSFAGLAETYWGLSGMSLSPNEAMPKARSAAVHALQLEPDLPEAHIALGVVRGWYEFDWAAAEAAFNRALHVRPNDAAARFWHGWTLVDTGRVSAGIAEARVAHDLDPLSAFVETGLAQMYGCAGQYQEEIKQLQSVVAADSTFFHGHANLGIAYLRNQRYAEAIRELAEANRLDPLQARPVAYLAYSYAKRGDAASAAEQATRLAALKESSYVANYLFAVVAAGKGATDEAMEWLARAYDAREDYLTMMRVDPVFEPWQNDSRFIGVLRQVGLQ